MSDLLKLLQRLGDAEHDDYSIAYDAIGEIVALRERVAELEAELLEARILAQDAIEEMKRRAKEDWQ